MPTKIGVMLPNSGPLPEEIGITTMARILEQAGFDSMWCRDHVVLPTKITTPRRDRFVEGGFWGKEADSAYTLNPWHDAMTTLAAMAAVTDRVELGITVLVLPYRHPIVVAKQVASIDHLSNGRVEGFGVGAGWLAQEFEFLGVPFEERGKLLDEGIALMQECWKGHTSPFNGKHYSLGEGALAYPTPLHEIPVFIGGNSKYAIRRAGRIPNGAWNPVRRADQLYLEELREGFEQMKHEAESVGRDPATLRFALRLSRSQGRADAIAEQWADLVATGLTEVVVDTDWATGDHDQVCEVLREADSRLGA